MESIIKKWKEDGKNLTPPEVYLALDDNDQKYFVYRDHSTIVFMVLDKSQITFCIPKKYCKLIEKNKKFKYYKITEYEKMIPVSCPSKNKYETFIQKYLID